MSASRHRLAVPAIISSIPFVSPIECSSSVLKKVCFYPLFREEGLYLETLQSQTSAFALRGMHCQQFHLRWSPSTGFSTAC